MLEDCFKGFGTIYIIQCSCQPNKVFGLRQFSVQEKKRRPPRRTGNFWVKAGRGFFYVKAGRGFFYVKAGRLFGGVFGPHVPSRFIGSRWKDVRSFCIFLAPSHRDQDFLGESWEGFLLRESWEAVCRGLWTTWFVGPLQGLLDLTGKTFSRGAVWCLFNCFVAPGTASQRCRLLTVPSALFPAKHEKQEVAAPGEERVW